MARGGGPASLQIHERILGSEDHLIMFAGIGLADVGGKNAIGAYDNDLSVHSLLSPLSA